MNREHAAVSAATPHFLLPSLPRVDDDRVLGVPRACDLEGLEQPVLAVPLVRARVRVRGEGEG